MTALRVQPGRKPTIQDANWTGFAFAMVGALLAVMFLRGVGVVGHRGSDADSEKTAREDPEDRDHDAVNISDYVSHVRLRRELCLRRLPASRLLCLKPSGAGDNEDRAHGMSRLRRHPGSPVYVELEERLRYIKAQIALKREAYDDVETGEAEEADWGQRALPRGTSESRDP
ncbi:hypothetical protein OH76DRAFT_1489166 [Lentinus brumalis]|uniref:Transmembrane protein n=1 Tax=Lentinus brumalis TaxID=2498619 RepID=A0A371CNP0_9APHY|nr:hypothetical protein OH76DRAFT_1489166 [Polyporus brumalis]